MQCGIVNRTDASRTPYADVKAPAREAQHKLALVETNLWLELTSVAVREGEPYRTVAAQISDAFLDWIKSSLDTDGASGHDESSAFVLTFVEGLVLLNAIGKEDEASRALCWLQ